jgi:hypothetical protein
MISCAFYIKPRLAWLGAILCAVVSPGVQSSDFGNLGLIKTPSARFSPDGTLGVAVTIDVVADIYNITYQATPWLEGTFRYSIFNPRDLNRSGDENRDRSYEVKARLIQEGERVPQVAVGVRDVLGTGVWEGEYIVASKALGPLDVSFGMGWGRLGSRGGISNPLGVFGEGFDTRPTGLTGGDFGGEDRGASFFRGDVGFFGGVSYQIPQKPIKLMLEYSADDHAREVGWDTLDIPSPWNFGVQWEPIANVTVTTSWLRGDSFGINFASKINSKANPRKKPGARFYSSAEPRALSKAPENLDLRSWYNRLLYDVERSGLRLHSATLRPGSRTAQLELSNDSYALTGDAVQRVLLLAEMHLPARVSSLDVLLRENGYIAPTLEYRLQRITADSRQRVGLSARSGSVAEESSSRIHVLEGRISALPSNVTDYGYPKVNLGADLATRVQLMDPDAPLAGQIYAKFSARASLSQNLDIWAVYGQDIYNDFSTDRVSNSRIQRVRSDVNRYLVEGESGLDQLYVEYRKSATPSLHYRAYAGILEAMYGGVGAEVLFAPFKSRVAFGATLNALRQRGFEKNFKFLDYKTVTGYLSLYYATPFYNLDAALHAGRYLGRDRGYTFEARRTFDSGFSLGGFFTRTNVSTEDFGEGSYDKGLFFRIPFNGLLPGNTRSAYTTIIRPLERDGGRRLEDFSGSIWFNQRATRYDSLDRQKKRMVP